MTPITAARDYRPSRSGPVKQRMWHERPIKVQPECQGFVGPFSRATLWIQFCQAVESAWRAGIVVVVAAGNDGRDNSLGRGGTDRDRLDLQCGKQTGDCSSVNVRAVRRSPVIQVVCGQGGTNAAESDGCRYRSVVREPYQKESVCQSSSNGRLADFSICTTNKLSFARGQNGNIPISPLESCSSDDFRRHGRWLLAGSQQEIRRMYRLFRPLAHISRSEQGTED